MPFINRYCCFFGKKLVFKKGWFTNIAIRCKVNRECF